ncbi:MAG: chemotaxis protein CheW [Anaerolineales bacterium]|nr:chemotaxis protein CheW [Anaerolineales bacterium]
MDTSLENNRFIPFVGFRLNNQHYTLPLEDVERALRIVAITPLPEAPPWVLGVIDLHGQAIPVIDLRQRFGLPRREIQLDDRLLVVQMPQGTYALLVDEVTQVMEIELGQVEYFPGLEERHHSAVSAVIRQNGSLALVVDLAHLEDWDGKTDHPYPEIIDQGAGQPGSTRDDLTRINGIGRVYARKLQSGGISTFAVLAAKTQDEIVGMLRLPQWRVPDVQSWIEQANQLK